MKGPLPAFLALLGLLGCASARVEESPTELDAQCLRLPDCDADPWPSVWTVAPGAIGCESPDWIAFHRSAKEMGDPVAFAVARRDAEGHCTTLAWGFSGQAVARSGCSVLVAGAELAEGTVPSIWVDHRSLAGETAAPMTGEQLSCLPAGSGTIPRD